MLHSLTCLFPGGMKTGIVGRTGCGKSTLIHVMDELMNISMKKKKEKEPCFHNGLDGTSILI